MISAVRAIHSAGLAARCITASKVVVVAHNRVQLSSVGAVDIVEPADQVGKTLADLQVADLIAVGRVLLCLITASPTAADTPQALRAALDVAHTQCSQDMIDCLRYLTAVDADSASRLPTGA